MDQKEGGAGGMKRKRLIAEICFSGLVSMLCMLPFLTVVIRGFWQEETGFTVQACYEVFLGTPRYLVRFWRSLGICLVIMAGQAFVSSAAGYAFAKCAFPGKTILYFLLMLLMILPLQVTLVPNYMMLDRLGLLGEEGALIWPAVFAPLGTFIMTQSFRAVPDEVLDVAMLDGCGLARKFGQVAVPIVKGGIVCVCLLAFLDGWNMVEQPIAYLKEFDQYPLSVALAYVRPAETARQFICCILVLLPPLFLFSCFHREMADGIVFGEEKQG